MKLTTALLTSALSLAAFGAQAQEAPAPAPAPGIALPAAGTVQNLVFLAAPFAGAVGLVAAASNGSTSSTTSTTSTTN